MGVDALHHIGTQNKREEMEVGKKNLPDKPWKIKDEITPEPYDPNGPWIRDRKIRYKPGYNGTGNYTKGEVKKIKSSRKDDPEKEQDKKTYN